MYINGGWIHFIIEMLFLRYLQVSIMSQEIGIPVSRNESNLFSSYPCSFCSSFPYVLGRRYIGCVKLECFWVTGVFLSELDSQFLPL
jgi:hypothetical protein